MVAQVDGRQGGIFCFKLSFLLLPFMYAVKLFQGTHTRHCSFSNSCATVVTYLQIKVYRLRWTCEGCHDSLQDYPTLRWVTMSISLLHQAFYERGAFDHSLKMFVSRFSLFTKIHLCAIAKKSNNSCASVPSLKLILSHLAIPNNLYACEVLPISVWPFI